MRKRQELCPQGLGEGKGKDVFLGRKEASPNPSPHPRGARARKAPEGASKARPVLRARNGARPCLRRRPERKHTASVTGPDLGVAGIVPGELLSSQPPTTTHSPIRELHTSFLPACQVSPFLPFFNK